MRHGASLVPVSVNISPRQSSQSDVIAMFRNAVARHRIDPGMLEIEMTESSMMQEGIGESAVFSQLRELGIKLCIDDFGTGYSSLSQLQKLRFDVLKIDRAFALRIEHPEGDTLIASMIAIAHALGMRVVAEGSESRRQMQLLQTLGCDEEQGFYFFAPGGARSAPGAAGPGLGGMSALSCSSCRRLFQRPGSLRRRPMKAIIPAPAASKARVPGSGTSAGSEPVNFCK